MYKVTKNNLVIEIPLTTERSNPYMEESPGEMDHICGIIDDSERGFGFWIDMDYSGKPDQNTSILFHWLSSEDKFKEFCTNNKISIITI